MSKWFSTAVLIVDTEILVLDCFHLLVLLVYDFLSGLVQFSGSSLSRWFFCFTPICSSQTLLSFLLCVFTLCLSACTLVVTCLLLCLISRYVLCRGFFCRWSIVLQAFFFTRCSTFWHFLCTLSPPFYFLGWYFLHPLVHQICCAVRGQILTCIFRFPASVCRILPWLLLYLGVFVIL